MNTNRSLYIIAAHNAICVHSDRPTNATALYFNRAPFWNYWSYSETGTPKLSSLSSSLNWSFQNLNQPPLSKVINNLGILNNDRISVNVIGIRILSFTLTFKWRFKNFDQTPILEAIRISQRSDVKESV